jgi:tungstate transport system ATP-binding protein
MSVVFQEPLLFNTSVYNNILLGLSLRKREMSNSKDLFEYLVEKLKIKNILRRNPRSLSGGEQQRVALTRALILEPELLLLDEPLANIDQVSREELRQDLFDIIRNTKRSTIYVTHDRNEAMIIADDVAVINEGRIEQFGQKNEVFRKPINTFVAKFVGVETILEGAVIECRNNVCTVKITKNERFNNSNGRNSDVNINKINNSSNYISDINYVLNSNLEVYVVAQSEINSEVMLAIRPEDVTLYDLEMPAEHSSAMNSFMGIVSDIQDIGIFKKIEIDCGFKLVSFVTQNSIERLGIEVGKKIIASVKASSIHMFKK